jgi:hypothetical protein
MHVGYWCERRKETYHYEEQNRWVDNMKIYLIENGVLWTVLFWLRIDTGGALLGTL